MNMTNLAKMSGKLPIALQIKWRDEAIRIRESRGFPNLKDLVDFIEQRAELMTLRLEGLMGRASLEENTQEVAVKHCLLSREEQLLQR